MSNKRANQKVKLFNLLSKGKEFSVNEIQSRLGIVNVTSVVCQLRDEGAPIYTNVRQGVSKYRLGTSRS